MLWSQTPYVYEKGSVSIVRDSFGVPHIYGKTDADAAYGLAWAHCEDAFPYIQNNMLAAKKRLGAVKGVDGALFDFAVQFFGIDTLVYNRYESDLSPEFRRVVEAYTQALNDYAQSHPKEVQLRGAFPIDPRDVVVGYTVNGVLMAGAGLDLKALNDNIMQEVFAPNEVGSNAMAVAPGRTEDGKAWLLGNSHQPIEGEFAWYEAHINSEEGWNFIGGLFPGGVTGFVGCNPYLGWSHTTNYHNFGDIYKLQLSKDKRSYRLDGEWKRFDYGVARLRVKLLGFLKVNIRRRYPISAFGPVFKKKHGWYALRYPAAMDIRAGEQWYRMNKARNIEEFEAALKMQALPLFNVVYADQSKNIFMVSEGKIPLRDTALRWTRPLDTDDSRYIWKQTLPYERKVRHLNPTCGYVFNCNGTPFKATCDQNDQCDYFPGAQLFTYNRHERFARMFNELEGKTLTWKDFLNIKYDTHYDPAGAYVRNFKVLFELDAARYPKLRQAIERIQAWDLSGDMDDRNASIAMLTNRYLATGTKMPYAFLMIKAAPITESEAVKALNRARLYLLRRFGTLDVPLGLVQRLARGKESLPVSGLSEVPRAVDVRYDRRYKCFRMRSGDGYFQLVRFGGKDGPEVLSVSPYGASSRPDSPHYTDQMRMFVGGQMKRMSFDRNEVLQSARRSYVPGE